MNSKNKREGFGRLCYYNDYIMEAYFIADRVNGFGRMCFDNNAYYIGQIKNNKKGGKGKFVYSDGSIEEITF